MRRYHPNDAPDADEWLALGEGERIDLAEEYHRRKKIRIPGARARAAFHTRLDAVQKDKKLTPQQKGQKVQALFWDMQRQRNALLTPEQQRKAEEIAKRQSEEMQRGSAPAPGGHK